MPYPAPFHRLVILGTVYNETFATSLSIVPNFITEWVEMLEVSEEFLATIAGEVSNWWTASDKPPIQAQAGVKLTGIKLNRIGTDGKYMDPETREHVYPTPIAGSGAGTSPAQCSVVSTLATARPRGRASKGRMYLPPCGHMSTLGTDGRLSTANAAACAASTKGFIDRVNSHYLLMGAVGVASDAGAGAFEHVTEVRVGRVVDTVRSRRASLLEDYQSVAV